MDSQTGQLINHIEIQAEMISKDVVELVSKLDYRSNEAIELTNQTTECMNDAIDELSSEIDLIIQSASNLVAVMQEISLDSEAVDRLRGQIRDINLALDVLEKQI